jgi:hypothetical protein
MLQQTTVSISAVHRVPAIISSSEAQPGSVSQPGHPFGPKDRRQRPQQAGHPSSRDDGNPVAVDAAPGDAGAVDGNDREHPDLGDAEDLVGLVGLAQHPAQGGHQQVAAMPQQPVAVQW